MLVIFRLGLDKMRREEIVKLQAGRLLQTAVELCEEKNYKDKLCRLKELHVLFRELQESFERLENKIALDFKKQTGLRASGPLWKYLEVKREDGKSSPPLTTRKQHKNTSNSEKPDNTQNE